MHAKEVKADILEAQSIGVQGVPFCFDNKYAVSGAQHVETFVKTLEKYGRQVYLKTNAFAHNRCRGPDGCN
jgi:predicted DsbA family dithiol-disulfide isomerase